MFLGCQWSPCYTPACSCPAPHCCSLPFWGSPSLFPFWPHMWYSTSLPPLTTCHQLPCLWCEDRPPPATEFCSRTSASRVGYCLVHGPAASGVLAARHSSRFRVQSLALCARLPPAKARTKPHSLLAAQNQSVGLTIWAVNECLPGTHKEGRFLTREIPSFAHD